MAYTPHRWIAQDEDAVCITCGMSEDDAVPQHGPMVPCITDIKEARR